MVHQPNTFDDELGKLSDDARRSEATRSRRERSDRSHAAALSATFTGSLVELLETQATTSVLTRSGNNVRGVIVAVGVDVVVVRSTVSSRTLVRTSAIEGLRGPGNGHDRHAIDVSTGPTWGDLLDELTHENSRLAITLASGNKVMGSAERVGLDQLVLRLDGGADSLTIPLPAIDQVVIDP